jgi:hypothetical protein
MFVSAGCFCICSHLDLVAAPARQPIATDDLPSPRVRVLTFGGLMAWMGRYEHVWDTYVVSIDGMAVSVASIWWVKSNTELLRLQHLNIGAEW